MVIKLHHSLLTLLVYTPYGYGQIQELGNKSNVNLITNSMILIEEFTICSQSKVIHKDDDFSSQEELVDYLRKDKNIITRDDVEEILVRVDRKDFMIDKIKPFAYLNNSQEIGFNTTISSPEMHAKTLEYLIDNLKKAKKVLDIGVGSGYLSACMALLIEDTGKVFSIDHFQEICDFAKTNISKSNKELIDKEKIIILNQDGRSGLEK